MITFLAPLRGPRLPLAACLVLRSLLLSAPLAAQQTPAPQTGRLVGRVIDAQTQQPIVEVTVRIRDSQHAALTDADGRFTIAGIPVGPKVVVLEHIGYGEHLRAVVVGGNADTPLSVRLTATALALDSIVVEAATELEQRRRSTGFAMNEIQRPAIDRASQAGLTLAQLLQQEMQGVRVRAGGSGANTCVEYRGNVNITGGCAQMAVFLDGIPVTAPSTLYATMSIGEIERLEALSPGQAGALYGTGSSWGVLLIETRRGILPRERRGASEELIFGFDWSMERESYAWFRVAGSSLVGNALGLGVSYLAANECFEVRSRGILSVQTSQCNAITTMLAGFLTLALPSVVGSYAARWAGGTERSRGRVLPGAIVGTIAGAGGYMLLVRGQGTNSDVLINAGAVILTLGTPLLLTLSDRALRVLR